MHYEGQSSAIQEFITTCRQHRLKITPQRVAIYRELVSFQTHPSADDVYRRVRRLYPHISFDTVNRTLSTFLKIGIVDVVEIFGGAKRFDINPDTHHHLHCTTCGRIFDFQYHGYDDLDVPEAVLKRFNVTGKRIVLTGVCRSCYPNRPLPKAYIINNVRRNRKENRDE